MLDWVMKIFEWVFRIWSALPDKTKERVVDAFVDGLEWLFRDFYRSYGGATA